jgi:hypothetical protein
MKASKFDQKFDEGKNVLAALDLAQAHRPGEEQKRINVDFPVWMLEAIDRQARHLGVTRQSVIKMWLAERLQAGH